MKISVIIPVYNGENNVSETIESVLNQTYQNFELVVIDDGSIDNTALILEEYRNKEKRIKIYRQENSGVSKARNTGISKANGQYITFFRCR